MMGQPKSRRAALRTNRWGEARWRLAQAELAISLSGRFPVRASPWMQAYAQDVRALLEALGESTATEVPIEAERG